MRWIITGSGGQLGRCLRERLAGGREPVLAAYDHASLDIGDPDAVSGVLGGLIAEDRAAADDPVALVNAAAFTAVDACETERDVAFRINGEAPRLLGELCQKEGLRFAHVSTDYVFDGRGKRPYREDDPTGPNSAYGASKLEGEQKVLAIRSDFLVVRTAWVFGPGKNFVKAILRQARLRRSGEVEGALQVVDDQIGCPTYAGDLAEGILALTRAGASGIVHLSNSEPASWWDFAREILDRCGYEELAIDRIRTADLDLPAPRPLYSVLDCSRAAAHGVHLRPWREALADYLQTDDALAAREGN